MRKWLLGSMLAGTCIALTAVPAAGAQSPSAPAATMTASAARSTDVTVENSTGCELRHYDSWLSHGIWNRDPASTAGLVRDGQSAGWGSESNGFLTGTEGRAVFVTQNCAATNLNRKVLHLHWDNPFSGSNSYDTNMSDAQCLVADRSGGSGNNASVTWRVHGTPGSCA
ncbi:aegerolysin family protein [Streptomyces melanogenes]|uniref:Aegerolysin family protein n=1 Tax=Streptomyces melanogenes TaxID=67326 RepID=A0ABZ1XWN6_9ACTN|nr:aegerolysin family protein [Streptomyces melanogenes]